MQRRPDEVVSSKIRMKDGSEASVSTHQSSLNGRSQYPSTFFKNRASSVPSNRETESATSTRKPRVVSLAEKTQRVSIEKLSLSAPDKEIPKVSPLLGRYKQMDRSTAPQRNIENTHQSDLLASSDFINETNLEKYLEYKQPTKAPYIQVVERSTEAGGKNKGIRSDANLESIICNACPDDSCIHSRQTIIEYVDLKRKLRECYSALQERGVELEELRSQIQFLKQANDELESRLQAKTDNIVAESTRDFQLIEGEWRKQECDLKQSIKELAAALEQERLDHSRTRNELEAAEAIHLQTKQQLEWRYGTFEVPSMNITHRDFVPETNSSNLVNNISTERCSTGSVVGTQTPRRRPPSVPLGLGVEGDLITTVDASFPHARALYSTQSNITNTVDSTLINVSDPSLAQCDYSHNFSMQTNLVEEVESCHESKKPDVDEGDGVTQRETEEGTTECDGRASSGDLRNPTLLCEFSSPGNTQPFDILYSVHPSSTHAFDHFGGQESLLCKELLRALLDKEKQLTEVVLERKALREELALLSA